MRSVRVTGASGVIGNNSLWFMNGLSAPVTAALPSVPDPNWKIVKIHRTPVITRNH